MSILTSCGTGEEPTKSIKYRVIKNNSSHSVELIIQANKQYTFKLEQEDSVIFEGYVKSGAGASYSNVGWNDSEAISGKVIFDNEKEIIYTDGNCENGRNPLNPYIWELYSCGYINKDSDGDGNSEWFYIIDESDYERAVPIED